MGVYAQPRERKLRHVGSSDDDEPRGPQARDRHSIARRGNRAAQHYRAGRGDVSCDVEEILHRYGNARVPQRVRASSAHSIVKLGGYCGLLRVNLEKCARAFAPGGLDVGKAGLDELPAAGPRRGEVGRQLCQGPAAGGSVEVRAHEKLRSR